MGVKQTLTVDATRRRADRLPEVAAREDRSMNSLMRLGLKAVLLRFEGAE